MPGSELLFAFVLTLFVGFAAFALVVSWWILRASMIETLKVNLRLADQVRDTSTCVIALSKAPYATDIAVAREETDRLIRATEAEGPQPVQNGRVEHEYRAPRVTMPTT